MPTDLPQPKPAPPQRKPWIMRYWMLPILVAIAGVELARPWINGSQPDWVFVGLAGAGIVFVLMVRLGFKA